MIKVLIIDDEPLARGIVKEYLHAYPDLHIVQECNDGFEGVKAIVQHQPDLIFLDIQMPELIDHPVSVIFTTAFDEHAIKAFEAHASDYLLKPFSKDRFDKAIQKWLTQRHTQKINLPDSLPPSISNQPEERHRVVVKKGANILIIPIGQVQYMEAYDDYVKIHTKDGMNLKKKTMSHFESVLDPAQFVRVHRSYIINLQELTRIEPLEKDNHIALLKSGVQIPLSQPGYSKLKSVLGI
jgi:two-component system, LytTR family, response regulator